MMGVIIRPRRRRTRSSDIAYPAPAEQTQAADADGEKWERRKKRSDLASALLKAALWAALTSNGEPSFEVPMFARFPGWRFRRLIDRIFCEQSSYRRAELGRAHIAKLLSNALELQRLNDQGRSSDLAIGDIVVDTFEALSGLK